jgi:hypothetical protein
MSLNIKVSSPLFINASSNGSESSMYSCYFSINSSSSDSHACDGWDKPGAKENEESTSESEKESTEHQEKENW